MYHVTWISSAIVTMTSAVCYGSIHSVFMNYVHSANIAYWITSHLKYKFWKKKKHILMTFCIKKWRYKRSHFTQKNNKNSYQNYRIIAHKNEDLWKIKNCTWIALWNLFILWFLTQIKTIELEWEHPQRFQCCYI